jgi:hypothetical protein
VAEDELPRVVSSLSSPPPPASPLAVFIASDSARVSLPPFLSLSTVVCGWSRLRKHSGGEARERKEGTVQLRGVPAWEWVYGAKG